MVVIILSTAGSCAAFVVRPVLPQTSTTTRLPSASCFRPQTSFLVFRRRREPRLVWGGVALRASSSRRKYLWDPPDAKEDDEEEEKVKEDATSDFPGGTSSSFRGAGLPRPELKPEDIPPLLMEALQYNDVPELNAGLNAMWEFAAGSSHTHYIYQNNRTDFIVEAHKTADEFPTSFYGAALNGKSWTIERPMNRVGGDHGWIATQVMKTICSDGRMRRWQWELRQNRRPPNLNVWYVESIGSSDRKGNFEPEED